MSCWGWRKSDKTVSASRRLAEVLSFYRPGNCGSREGPSCSLLDRTAQEPLLGSMEGRHCAPCCLADLQSPGQLLPVSMPHCAHL